MTRQSVCVKTLQLSRKKVLGDNICVIGANASNMACHTGEAFMAEHMYIYICMYMHVYLRTAHYHHRPGNLFGSVFERQEGSQLSNLGMPPNSSPSKTIVIDSLIKVRRAGKAIAIRALESSYSASR